MRTMMGGRTHDDDDDDGRIKKNERYLFYGCLGHMTHVMLRAKL